MSLDPKGIAQVSAARDAWMPAGFAAPEEARLGEAAGLLSAEHRKALTEWWLAVRHARANTPNWDIASSATIDRRKGLVLVEAKAHANEIKDAGKLLTETSNVDNHAGIEACCRDASAALGGILPGFALSAQSHYQLCNRFAWSWRLASLGIPVVLVYLGFLHAEEMRSEETTPFESDEEWRATLRIHAHGVVPDGAWDGPMLVHGTPFHAIVHSLRVDLDGRIWAQA